jgi:hypothetical protein
MKTITPTSLFVFSILSLGLMGCVTESALPAAAVRRFYGVVESYGGGQIVMKTTQHSTGTWKVDRATQVTGAIREYDWVSVEVEKSGHVTSLQLEEHPTLHGGVVKAISGNGVVLTVHSGPNMESWNKVETTLGDRDVAVGDEIGVKVYSNHNLAYVQIIKHGVK